MSNNVKYSEKKQSNLNSIISKLKTMKMARVFVGVHNDGSRSAKATNDTEDLTNVQVAYKNEFGSETNPERSFIRASINVNREKYREMNKVSYQKLLNGRIKNPIDYFEQLGAVAQSDMQKFAIDLKTPENSKRTIEKKGSSNPLVDTGQMISSISYVVESNNKAETN